MCLIIGPRCHVGCSSLTLLNGSQIAWVDNIRYLGVYLKCFRHFSCCFDVTRLKGPFSEVVMQYSEKLEGQLLKILFYICLNLSAYLVCYMHSKHAQ